MSTVLDLIKGSLRLIQVVDPDESLPQSQADDALAALNSMIEAWNLEHLLLFSEQRQTVSFTSSTQTYTVGSGATWNINRPIKIERVGVISGTSELPVRIINQETWASVVDKTATGTFPQLLYIDNAYASGFSTATVWPVPTTSGTLAIYAWTQLTSLSTLETTVSFPPGYERALRYCLALELCAEYGKEVPPAVAATAMRAIGAIKRANAKPYYLKCDVGTLGVSGLRTGFYDGKADIL